MEGRHSPRGFAPATTAESTSETTAPRRNRRDRLVLCPSDFVAPRYADVADLRLARTLTAEDRSEEDGLDALERVTCRTCECALNVAIDQPAGDVAVRCPSCSEAPATRATRQLVRACRAGLATAADR